MLHVHIGCISTCSHPSSREKEREEERRREREDKWKIEKRMWEGKKM